ncbi:MAG: LTA synthase family protein [Treponema sp.]|nr:LTA synthase family protein [Treponema sp.]
MFFSLFVLLSLLWFLFAFNTVSLEQLVYHFLMPLNGANLSIVLKFFVDVIINSLILTVFLFFISGLELQYKKAGSLWRVSFNKYRKKALLALQVLLALASLVILIRADAPALVMRFFEGPSLFYEEHYIDPAGLNFSFPPEKRNLIVIFVESLETGFFSTARGGAFAEELIPEVYDMASGHINFSHSDTVGGASQVYGTGWTMAGIVASYAGIPSVAGMNEGYGEMMMGKKILPGITTIGDILAGQGYRNYFMLGSKGEFAGRDNFFITHGNTEILDYHYFHGNEYIPKNYYVWWGFEDRKLYAFAKEKLSQLGKSENPFFFTLLTADTHSTDGYLDDKAETAYPSKFKNVLADMSKQLHDFITWLKGQEFYENTTVAILGDHLYMDGSIFSDRTADRRPLNVFINSLLPGDHVKNREFSHFDLFPTLIDSIGGTYDVGGLGLGRSMSRGGKTLLETMGSQALGSNLAKKSLVYRSFFKE